jgi:hypothetical protein
MAHVANGAFNSTGVSATLALAAPTFTHDGGAGQLLVAVCCAHDDIVTIATPSGWEVRGTQAYDSANRDVRWAVFTRDAESGDSAASWNFVKSSNDFNLFYGRIALYDGVDLASILDATGLLFAHAVGTGTTLPAYDPASAAGQLLHIAIHTDNGSANADYTTTPPASSTVRYDEGVGTTGGSAANIALADRTHDGTALGSTSWGTGGSATVIGITLALNNASAGSTEDMEGTAAGTSTATATASQTLSIAGTAAGTSTVAGAASQTLSIAATAAGTSAMTEELSLDIYQTQTLGGTSTMTGVLTLVTSIAGTAAGTSDATGEIETDNVRDLEGAAAGTSTLSGTLTLVRTIAGAAAGTSTASGQATRVQAIAGAAAGTSGMTGGMLFTELVPSYVFTPAARSLVSTPPRRA